MIKELHIENYALINKLSLEFYPQFNVITGETGAGKTVIISALSLLLGERAETDKISDKKLKSLITGVFDIDDEIVKELHTADINAGNRIIIKRVIQADGKSSAYIDDSPVSVRLLKDLGNMLVDLHGQYEHQMLLEKKYQLKLIDIACRNEENVYSFYQLKTELENLSKEKLNLERTLMEWRNEREFLEFAEKELSEVNFDDINEQEINAKLNELENYNEIESIIGEVLEIVEGDEDNSFGAILKIITEKLKKIENYGENFKNINHIFSNARTLLYEGINELTYAKEKMVYDSSMLLNLRSLVDKIENLKRKYKMSFEELIEYKKSLKEKIDYLMFPDEKLSEINEKIDVLHNELIKEGEKMHILRERASKELSKSVNEKLSDMNMKDSSFSVDIAFNTENIRNDGFDDIEFLISNKMSNGMPLKKTASGGELSRIMLAIKSSLKADDPVGVLVFDEIDTGISGKTAQMVSLIMENLSKNKQLIVITHLPQIASKAVHHFCVEKKKTGIEIKHLKDEERVEEIARLLGSSISKETALKHAKALLKK